MTDKEKARARKQQPPLSLKSRARETSFLLYCPLRRLRADNPEEEVGLTAAVQLREREKNCCLAGDCVFRRLQRAL